MDFRNTRWNRTEITSLTIIKLHSPLRLDEEAPFALWHTQKLIPSRTQHTCSFRRRRYPNLQPCKNEKEDNSVGELPRIQSFAASFCELTKSAEQQNSASASFDTDVHLCSGLKISVLSALQGKRECYYWRVLVS